MNYMDTVRRKLAKTEPEETPRMRVVTVRMSPEMKRQLDALAHELEVSLNQLCVTALQTMVDYERQA
jgi:predicted HicB family RNase H-like nuclease